MASVQRSYLASNCYSHGFLMLRYSALGGAKVEKRWSKEQHFASVVGAEWLDLHCR